MKSTKTKPAKRKPSVRLLRRIQNHILAEPKRFLMSCSVIKAPSQQAWNREIGMFSPDASKIMPPCGTAACIAGWADILTGGNGGGHTDLIERAAGLLGVEEQGTWTGHTLFSSPDWPEPFATRYRHAKKPSRRAKIAADRIEHLIKTGE